MSEEELRVSYSSTRILIESSRVLNPQFSDAVLHITAPQIEMLRNIVYYLSRNTTFVDTYHEGYYMMPDSDDQDVIASIVADLENVLMGNDNVIFGYTDRYGVAVIDTTMPSGNSNLDAPAVLVSEVWRVLGYSAVVTSASCTGWRIALNAGGTTVWLDGVISPSSTVLYSKQIDVVLKKEDFMYGRFYGMTLNDTAELYLWGYKMQVPT